MVGMVNGGSRRARRTDSLTNQGCQFGSMSGLAPRTGIQASFAAGARLRSNYCFNKCLPTGCKEGLDFLVSRGLITYNKGTGGIGRMQTRPGLGRLFGSGNHELNQMPQRNGQRSRNGRSATARRVLFSGPGSTDGMYVNTNNGGGVKKGGAQPSATGFMIPFAQRMKIATPALNSDYLFNFRQKYNFPRNSGPML